MSKVECAMCIVGYVCNAANIQKTDQKIAGIICQILDNGPSITLFVSNPSTMSFFISEDFTTDLVKH